MFVHDSLPAEGISGMIIFLRHFKQLKGWDIHILIPENAYQEAIVKQYPPHFHVHTFPLRLSWWPTFREDISIMVKLRLLVLSKLFKTYINKIKPNVLVTVQYHYYSVALSSNSKKTGIPLITFLHDRWDLTSHNHYIQSVRKYYARQALQKSEVILAVTENIVTHYLDKMPEKAKVFYPIPEGFLSEKKTAFHQKKLIYAGTVEGHHLTFFESILPLLKEIDWQFTVISNTPEKLKKLAQEYKCLAILPAFKTNRDAISYIKKHGGVILINYGLSQNDNPFAFHSFPSKFVEYCGLGLPILAVAPPGSPFHQFLKEKSWLAFMEQFSLTDLKNLLLNFNDEYFYQQNINQARELSESQFNRQIIQSKFEDILIQVYNK